MKPNDVVWQIESLFAEASQDLIRGMNCDVSVMETECHEVLDAPIALIDAGTADLELQIALELPMAVLALSYPVPNISVVDDESLEDWISELSNQLMGRLKTKLLKRDQDVMLGLPGSFFGVDIGEIMTLSEHRYTVYLNVDGEACAFHIGVETLSDEISFTEADADEEELMESEIELF
mgnify:CR=1 FL=1